MVQPTLPGEGESTQKLHKFISTLRTCDAPASAYRVSGSHGYAGSPGLSPLDSRYQLKPFLTFDLSSSNVVIHPPDI